VLNRRWFGKRKPRNIENVHFVECGMNPTGLRHYKRFDLIESSRNVHGSLRSRHISLSPRGYACVLRVLCTSLARTSIALDFNLTSIDSIQPWQFLFLKFFKNRNWHKFFVSFFFLWLWKHFKIRRNIAIYFFVIYLYKKMNFLFIVFMNNHL